MSEKGKRDMSKTYVIDGNSLLFRAYYSTAYTGNLMTNKDGIPTNAVFAFHNLMKKLKAMANKGDHFFVAFDTDKPTFRKQEFENYKAQRSPCPDELVVQLPIARELLDAMNIHWKEWEGYEADDLCGSVARYALSKGDEVVLCSSDRDFLQLLSLEGNISIIVPKKGLSETIVYSKDNLLPEYGLNPDQITDFKGLAGDPSDNYNGIEGIGEKTAKKLLNTYGHLEDIIEHCKTDSSKTSQKILAGQDKALFFKHIATIDCDLDMEEDYKESSYRPYERKKLSTFYVKYQFSQFIKSIDKMKDLQDEEEPMQLSLEDMMESSDSVQNSIKESSSAKHREIVNIESFVQINEEIKAITYDADSENENTCNIMGFALANDRHCFYISAENARNDEAFKHFLVKDKKIAVYDLKGLDVILNRLGLPFIKGVNFDLLLAAYLINPDVGQKKKDLFLTYGLNVENITYLDVISITLDFEESILSEIEKHGEKQLFEEIELPLAEVLACMEIEGVPMDKETMREINTDYNNKLDGLRQEIYNMAGGEFNINSTWQLADVLFEKLGLHRGKGEKGTSSEVLNHHLGEHPIIEKILEYRLYNKLVSSYTSTLEDHLGEDNKIHALYNQALTATGRLSMSEPNLQNISIRNEEGKIIRTAFFYPDDDTVILSLDYSQIELRVLAHIAKEETLTEIFKEGKDIHRATAAKIYGVPFEEVTDDMRRKAKTVNFGIIYGISTFGLKEQLGISNQEAKELIESFKREFSGIDAFEQECIEKARTYGYVSTLTNRRRYLPNINSSNRQMRSFSERAAVNTVIQGSAADLMKIAMIKCDKVLKENFQTRIILQIHDELLFKVPKDELERVKPVLIDTMEHAMDLDVPLVVEGTASKDWYGAH